MCVTAVTGNRCYNYLRLPGWLARYYMPCKVASWPFARSNEMRKMFRAGDGGAGEGADERTNGSIVVANVGRIHCSSGEKLSPVKSQIEPRRGGGWDGMAAGWEQRGWGKETRGR